MDDMSTVAARATFTPERNRAFEMIGRMHFQNQGVLAEVKCDFCKENDHNCVVFAHGHRTRNYSCSRCLANDIACVTTEDAIVQVRIKKDLEVVKKTQQKQALELSKLKDKVTELSDMVIELAMAVHDASQPRPPNNEQE